MIRLLSLLACLPLVACQHTAPTPAPAASPVAATPAPSTPAPAVPAAAAPTSTDWRDQLWPAHRDAVLARPRIVLADDAAQDHLAVASDARALLVRADHPQPLGEIGGAWRARSLQFGTYGAFGYPWFAAEITTTGGIQRFTKTTGSQRRSGRLVPGDTPDTRVFIGGAAVNNDPIPPYSLDANASAEEPVASDSVGRLVRIGPSDLLMVLDVDGSRFELYHLQR